MKPVLPLVLIALFLGSVWWWVNRGRVAVALPAPLRSALGISSPATAAPKQPDEPANPKKAASGRRHGRADRAAVETAPELFAALAPPPLPAQIAPPRVSPRPSDVPAGCSRALLLARFGQPDLRVQTMERGEVLETYCYRRPADGTVTLIRLRSGVVYKVNVR
jgi:hypothetical protein